MIRITTLNFHSDLDEASYIEMLRDLVRDKKLRWVDFTRECNHEGHCPNPRSISGIMFRTCVGPYLGRPAVACMTDTHFVAIRYFRYFTLPAYQMGQLYHPLSPGIGYEIRGYGGWCDFDPEELIIKD